MTKQYLSEALGALHETARGLLRLGLVDTKTMREFDASCLTLVERLSPKQTAEMRRQAGVSQAVAQSDKGNHMARFGGAGGD